MRVWTICVSEPLPVDEGRQRPMRAGMLVGALATKQHQVTWWTSAFNHSNKRHRTPNSTALTSSEGIRSILLRGVGYTRNIGVPRLVNHYQVAREFDRLCEAEIKPDLIFCCWPTIELGFAAVHYACRHSVPIVLDVRDLWPDIYADIMPGPLRPFGRAVLAPYFHMTRSAFRRCTARSEERRVGKECRSRWSPYN